MKTFAQSRPVLYGAPTAAVLGVILGLVFRVGAQIDSTSPPEPVNRAAIEDTATPIAWPSGKVPDYVVGTDFLASTRQQQPVVASYYRDEEPFVMPPPMDVPPPLVTAARAAPTQTTWASTEGDILNVRLPEDPPEGAPALD